MNWLNRAISSSIGKKVLMAITGLLLCGFLVAHLGGNLLLYKSEASYNEYADALHHQEALLVVAEVGLLVLFVVHIYLALKTQQENSGARPIPYDQRRSKIEPGAMAAPASSVMFGTGVVVLLFLLLHLADFRFELRNAKTAKDEPTANATEMEPTAKAAEGESHAKEAGEKPYAKAARLMTDWLTFVTYIIGSLALGYHVLHGFQSAFQSLGLNHPKYTPFIKFVSLIFAIIVGFGFASFPIWAMMRSS